ncbi:MAG: motility protein MotB [Alphaproteobacteria bacterium]|nr:MAG: motility protein MotB [Alphaproteobacteria bacterium]
MANDDQKNAPPTIIIKKVKKGGHGGHHGGAWKVAYADFVTAMMAFFLLLWLLQATTEEQKLGIANYFAPTTVSRSTSGGGGLMGGRTFTKTGAAPNDQSPIGVMIKIPTNPPDWDNTGDPEENTATEETGAGGSDGNDGSDGAEATDTQIAIEEPSPDQIKEMLAKREEEQFEAAEKALREAIENVPDLRGLMENLIIDRTEEGMRIQIVDKAGKSMFPSGSAEMFEHTKKLIRLVADAVRQLPQRIAIKGHTDATPFNTTHGYTNWELSTDRANASRRALIEAGLPPERIASVVGLADTEPLDKNDPYAPRNRRVSIILLRDSPPPAQSAKLPPSLLQENGNTDGEK